MEEIARLCSLGTFGSHNSWESDPAVGSSRFSRELGSGVSGLTISSREAKEFNRVSLEESIENLFELSF